MLLHYSDRIIAGPAARPGAGQITPLIHVRNWLLLPPPISIVFSSFAYQVIESL